MTLGEPLGPLAWFAGMIDHCYDYAQEARDQGQPIVGIMCEFTPREIILAALTAVVLARHLASAVAPGGQLLIANMVDHPTRWLMEHHLDWPLIYRTRQQLLDLGARAAPGAQARILEEESGANPFLELVRT